MISLFSIFASESPPIEMMWLPFTRFSSGFFILTIPSKPSSSLLYNEKKYEWNKKQCKNNKNKQMIIAKEKESETEKKNKNSNNVYI